MSQTVREAQVINKGGSKVRAVNLEIPGTHAGEDGVVKDTSSGLAEGRLYP